MFKRQVLPVPLRLILHGLARRREGAHDRMGGPPSAHGRSEVPQARGVPLSPIWVTVRLAGQHCRIRKSSRSQTDLDVEAGYAGKGDVKVRVFR